MHEDSAPDRSHTSLTQSVLDIRGREGFFVKKTIIALAAASSVALSHGVAVADDVKTDTTQSSSAKQGLSGSADKDNKVNDQAPEKGTEDKKDEQDKEKDSKGSSAQKFFGWKDDASGLDKLIKIGAAVAAVVALLGSISSLFANIEKIVKQFNK